MKKRLYMIIALLYCGSVLSGCSMSQESMSGDDKENNNIKVEKTVDDNKGKTGTAGLQYVYGENKGLS